ncbi:MAG: helix-turn-helix domain-containing protein, partial [Gemmatimonadales bacterium]
LPGCPAAATSDALERLSAAPWPGNIRELRSTLERAMLGARGAPLLDVGHLPPELRRGTRGDRRHQPHTLAELERLQIERALRHHGGNRTHAARELGISRATLINKIRTFALDL